MRITVGQLKKLIKEEREYAAAIQELLGENSEFGSILDSVLSDLGATNKKIEKAHEIAPQGPARAIIAGLHSDLFNKVAEFRKYIAQLKKLAAGGSLEAHAEGFRRRR